MSFTVRSCSNVRPHFVYGGKIMGMGFGLYGGVPIFEILFVLMFVLVIGMFLVTAVKGISQWNKNNHSPRLTVEALVVKTQPRYGFGR